MSTGLRQRPRRPLRQLRPGMQSTAKSRTYYYKLYGPGTKGDGIEQIRQAEERKTEGVAWESGHRGDVAYETKQTCLQEAGSTCWGWTLQIHDACRMLCTNGNNILNSRESLMFEL